jgi:pyrroloquinoline-quinone synthase
LHSGQCNKGQVQAWALNRYYYQAMALAYFDRRPQQASRDANFALNYVKREASSLEQQQQVLASLEFKCSVLWAMCDALFHAYVNPQHIPPGSFVPK